MARAVRAHPEKLGLTVVPPVAKKASRSSVPIDPAEYVIKRGFVHDGRTFGRGEKVPAMTARQADTLRAEGKVALLNEEGALENRFARTPESVNDYMRGNDLTVLQRIRAHPPSVSALEEIVERAQRGRTQIFREAVAVCLELTQTKERKKPATEK